MSTLYEFYLNNISNNRSALVNNTILNKNNLKSNIIKQNNSIKVKYSEIKLSFLYSKVEDVGFCIYYLINLSPRINPTRDPGFYSRIDKIAFKKALEENVRPQDRKYMKVDEFDFGKVKIRFDIDNFLKDCNITGRTHLSSLDRVFTVNNQIPSCIRIDTMTKFAFEEYFLKEFKKKIKRDFEAKHFTYLFPLKYLNGFSNLMDLFNWNYDLQYNKVTARMKTIYILAFLFSVGKISSNIRKEQISSNSKRVEFSDRVHKSLKKFDVEKWKKIIRIKNIK